MAARAGDRAHGCPLGPAARVVMQHIPMWGDGASLDSRAKWAELLARARVSAMICGHTHEFLLATGAPSTHTRSWWAAVRPKQPP